MATTRDEFQPQEHSFPRQTKVPEPTNEHVSYPHQSLITAHSALCHILLSLYGV